MTVDEAHPKSPYDGRRVLPFEHLLIAAYWFGSNFMWGAFLGPVLSSQMDKLNPGNPASSLGLIYLIGTIPAMVIPLIAGPLSDRCRSRFGRRKPFVVGGGVCAIIGLAMMATGFSWLSLPLYFLGNFVLQIGSNVALGAYSGIIPDLIPDNQRGIASGYMAVMSQVSTLLGAVVSGALISANLHIPLYAVIGAVYAVFIVVTFFGVKEAQLIADLGKVNWKAAGSHMLEPLRSRDFLWVWITRALMMLGFYGIQPFLLYYLRDVIKVPDPAATVGGVLALVFIAATISGFLGGWISDRTGRKPVVIWSSVLIAVFSLGLVFCNTLPQALGVGVLFGLCYGAYISVDWALGTDVLPNKMDAGKDMAVWHISMTLPQVIAPFYSSLILGLYPGPGHMKDGVKVATYAWPGFVIIFGIAAFAFLLGGILVRNVRGAR